MNKIIEWFAGLLASWLFDENEDSFGVKSLDEAYFDIYGEYPPETN